MAAEVARCIAGKGGAPPPRLGIKTFLVNGVAAEFLPVMFILKNRLSGARWGAARFRLGCERVIEPIEKQGGFIVNKSPFK